jgi:regulatory protein
LTFGEGRSKRPSKQARKSGGDAAAAAPELTRRKLEELALSYINRFDCTASKLKSQLRQRVRKLGGHPDAEQWIAEQVERYQSSGVLDDARFARNLSAQLTRRGKSSRAISQKLAVRGVPSELAGELMAERRQNEPGAELEAARAFVKKRRLGPFRAPEARAQHRQKDLASLARQGFSFDTARSALAVDSSDEEQ